MTKYNITKIYTLQLKLEICPSLFVFYFCLLLGTEAREILTQKRNQNYLFTLLFIRISFILCSMF